MLTLLCTQAEVGNETKPPGSDEPSFQGLRPFVKNITRLSDYRLVWQDEFDISRLDSSKWSVENSDGCPYLCGFGNNELQFYSPQNLYIQNGKLVIKAQREDLAERHRFKEKEYTSAKLFTRNKAAWRYGIFEVRAKLPTTQGLWPAIWMMPEESTYGGWPYSGEIDIMEVVGRDDRLLYGTLHYFSRIHNTNAMAGREYKLSDTMSSFSEEFYVFTIVWSPGFINWYVDGKHYHFVSGNVLKGAADSKKNLLSGLAPFDREFHIILNTAVGGRFPGNPNNSTRIPQYMYIDYVRVFQIP